VATNNDSNVTKDIEFRFIIPPEAIPIDNEDESTLPLIDVDASAIDLKWQAILLRILPTIWIESKNNGAEYMFSKRDG